MYVCISDQRVKIPTILKSPGLIQLRDKPDVINQPVEPCLYRGSNSN